MLYLSIGEPRPAVGTDIGDGFIVRYDEQEKEVVGITIIGLKERTYRAYPGIRICPCLPVDLVENRNEKLVDHIGRK